MLIDIPAPGMLKHPGAARAKWIITMGALSWMGNTWNRGITNYWSVLYTSQDFPEMFKCFFPHGFMSSKLKSNNDVTQQRRSKQLQKVNKHIIWEVTEFFNFGFVHFGVDHGKSCKSTLSQDHTGQVNNWLFLNIVWKDCFTNYA